MANTQKRIARILTLKSCEEQNKELLKLATEKGASHDRLWTATPAGAILDQPELIRRIHEADKALRESPPWWVDWLSPVISILKKFFI